MSIIGSYRASGIGASGNVYSDRILNFTGFKPSGITAGNILGVGLYVWSGEALQRSGDWIPLRREWL